MNSQAVGSQQLAYLEETFGWMLGSKEFEVHVFQVEDNVSFQVQGLIH